MDWAENCRERGIYRGLGLGRKRLLGLALWDGLASLRRNFSIRMDM